MIKKRLNTQLAASGAEFIVLGKLLLNEIEAYKTYGNFEGYDIVAVNPINNKSCKIQIKSKNFKNDTSFYLNSEDKNSTDFYVFCQTNIYQYINKVATFREDFDPKFFIINSNIVKKFKKNDKKNSDYLLLSSIPEINSYKDNWGQIKKFLNYKL
jgi:hypothetical protein